MSTVVNVGFHCAQRTGWKFVMLDWGQTSELSAYCIPGNLQLQYLWSKLSPFLLTPNPAGNHKVLTRDHCFLCSNTFLTPCYPSKSSSPSFIGFVVLSNTLHQPVLDFSLHIQGFLVSKLSWYQIFAGYFIDGYHLWKISFLWWLFQGFEVRESAVWRCFCITEKLNAWLCRRSHRSTLLLW